MHLQYLPLELDSQIQDWEKDKRYIFETEAGNWIIRISLTNGRKRFCAGWNKFIRENNLKKGDMLDFNFAQHESRFVINIRRI